MGCMGLSFLDLIVIWHMGLCHFLKIWFTLLINQPFKTLLGASNFFKNSWTCFSYIIPFKNIFRLPFPLKIVIFGSIFYPSIFDFSNVPIVKSYSLQLWLCPYTLQFRETMQGWWRFFLSVEYLNSHICKREKLFTSLAFQSQ